MLKLKPANNVTPPRYIDQKALTGTNLKDEAAIYGDAYIAGFTKLWGLS
jgi:hypothetical protein